MPLSVATLARHITIAFLNFHTIKHNHIFFAAWSLLRPPQSCYPIATAFPPQVVLGGDLHSPTLVGKTLLAKFTPAQYVVGFYFQWLRQGTGTSS